MIDPYISPWEAWLQKWFVRLLIPAILVNAGGLLITILEPDGALYATIAKTIAQTGDFINLRVEGRDWLDKPHFPFWMAALSFRIVGISGFAYKLPALIFWAAGGWYTYRLALSLYGKPVAQLATLVYVSAAHLVISNNDVRAEPYLTGLVIGSVFHFYKASRIRPGVHLVAGSLLAACAVMTKGPFVLITISAGFLLDWIKNREWRQFRNARWWVAIGLTALFITPELYCLYIQFDHHPEKWIFGHQHVSGIRFFFWDSQFGRFFNTGPIKGSGDPFFYFHTVLWAFLPWSILLYAAIVQKCRNMRHPAVQGDLICLGSAGMSFIVFSLSRFQLPHYLNILFPFFAILTANYLYGIRRKSSIRAIRITQGLVTGLLPVLLLSLCWLFHFGNWPGLMLLYGFLSGLPWLLFRGETLPAPILRSCWQALVVFAFVNFSLYPAILKYQAGSEAGKTVFRYRGPFRPAISEPAGWPGPARPRESSVFYQLQEAPANYSFEFYCPVPVQRIPIDSLTLPAKDGYINVFAPSRLVDSLEKRGYSVITTTRFPNFHISQLTGEFLNYTSRDSTLEWYSMMQVARPAGAPKRPRP